MSTSILIRAFIGGLVLGIINSYYWYKKGYRGGKLLFMGTVGFSGIILMILKLSNG